MLPVGTLWPTVKSKSLHSGCISALALGLGVYEGGDCSVSPFISQEVPGPHAMVTGQTFLIALVYFLPYLGIEVFGLRSFLN